MKKVIRIFLEVLFYYIVVLLVILLFKKIGWLDGDIWALSIGSTIGFILYKLLVTILKK